MSGQFCTFAISHDISPWLWKVFQLTFSFSQSHILDKSYQTAIRKSSPNFISKYLPQTVVAFSFKNVLPIQYFFKICFIFFLWSQKQLWALPCSWTTPEMRQKNPLCLSLTRMSKRVVGTLHICENSEILKQVEWTQQIKIRLIWKDLRDRKCRILILILDPNPRPDPGLGLLCSFCKLHSLNFFVPDLWSRSLIPILDPDPGFGLLTYSLVSYLQVVSPFWR